MNAWPDADRRSRLVLIVKGLAPAAIERSLHAFSMMPTSSHLRQIGIVNRLGAISAP
jgi:hypothetical protein